MFPYQVNLHTVITMTTDQLQQAIEEATHEYNTLRFQEKIKLQIRYRSGNTYDLKSFRQNNKVVFIYTDDNFNHVSTSVYDINDDWDNEFTTYVHPSDHLDLDDNIMEYGQDPEWMVLLVSSSNLLEVKCGMNDDWYPVY